MESTPQNLQEQITVKLGERCLKWEAGELPAVHIAPGEVYSVVRDLYDDAGLGFRFLTSMCGIHFTAEVTGGEEQLGLVYFLHDLPRNRRLRLKTVFPVAQAEVESITPLFASANWMEREAFDFYGIKFKNHPNLIRILNIESMTVFPLRKDFPLEDRSRHDKNDKMFGR
jgi:NADH-quinone oxidoreductase subunit C